MAYTNQSRIEQYIMLNIDDSFSSWIGELISSAEAYIDKYCNRTFEQETATTKLYDGDGTSTLIVKDLLTLTKIEFLDGDGDVSDDTTDSNDWRLYPVNEEPKNKIWLNPEGGFRSVFPTSHQKVRLTGTFGHSVSVPEPIRLAATKIIGAVIKEQNLDITGEIKKEQIGDYNIEYQGVSEIADALSIKNLLDPYVRYTF